MYFDREHNIDQRLHQRLESWLFSSKVETISNDLLQVSFGKDVKGYRGGGVI